MSRSAAELDRRQLDRHDVLTAVTVVVLSDDSAGFSVVKAWSRDISGSGARIVSTGPLAGTTLYLRFLLPGSVQHFVEARVVNASTTHLQRLSVGLTCEYSYGVTFTALVSDAALLDRLHRAADPAAAISPRLAPV